MAGLLARVARLVARFRAMPPVAHTDGINVGIPRGTHEATIPGGSAGNPQTFRRVCTGLETASFVQGLPTARASANYNAIVVDGGRTDGTLSTFTAPVSGYTATQLQVECSQAPAAGDVILFHVVDLT